VGRLATAGQHSGDVSLFPRALSGWRRREHRADLEQAHILNSLSPVALHQPNQAREQSPPEIAIAAGQRIQKPDAVGTVRGASWEWRHFEQSLARESSTKLGRDPLDGGIRQRAQPERPEIGWKLFIAMQARNLFDEIHLSSQVGTPAWSFNGDTAILRLGHKRSAHSHEVVLERLPGELHAEKLRDPRRLEEDPRRV
jgi:hypothetical protein